MEIELWNAERDGPFTEAALRRQLEARGYRVTRYVYAPGAYFPPHTHDCDKIDAVLSGRFRVTLQGEDIVLEAGDAIAIPRGVFTTHGWWGTNRSSVWMRSASDDTFPPHADTCHNG